jgi:hypothetical protein
VLDSQISVLIDRAMAEGSSLASTFVVSLPSLRTKGTHLVKMCQTIKKILPKNNYITRIDGLDSVVATFLTDREVTV